MPGSTSKPPRGVEVGRHPSWCSPRLCIDTGADTEHASPPSRLDTADEMWEASLVRSDEHAFPGDPGGIHARIDVTNTALLDHDAQHVMAVEDLPRVAHLLLALYERATFPPATS